MNKRGLGAVVRSKTPLLFPHSLVVLLGTMLFACNTSDFSGNNHSRSDVEPAEQVAPSTPVDNSQQTPPQTSNQVVANPTTQTSPQPTTTDTDVTPKFDFGQILSGLLNVLKNVEVAQPSEDEIIFGGQKVFHIGDGEFARDSNCASEIHAYLLRGTQYFFEFEVTQDNTTVNTNINKICGIDYEGTNEVLLQDASSTTIDKTALAKASTSTQLAAKTLNAGKYVIVVLSNEAGNQNENDPNDHDDFIVGGVQIKADKPIKPGRVGAK